MRILTDNADIHVSTCGGTLQEQLHEVIEWLDAIDRGDTKPYVDNVTEKFIPEPNKDIQAPENVILSHG